MDKAPKAKEKRKALCVFYKTGDCTNPLNCGLDHVDCIKATCKPNPDVNCIFGHPWLGDPAPKNVKKGGGLKSGDTSLVFGGGAAGGAGGGTGGGKNKAKKVENDDDDASSIASAESRASSTFSGASSQKSVEKEFCKLKDCFDVDCPLKHLKDRNLCVYSKSCTDIECQQVHPPQRPKGCKKGVSCWKSNCKLLHPVGWDPCLFEAECLDFDCSSSHPSNRPKICRLLAQCRNVNCDCLHPSDWDPFSGIDVAPTLVKQSSSGGGGGSKLPPPPPKVIPVAKTTPDLKSITERYADRVKASLPILDRKSEICERLMREKVLVVTAATGSGKTTQIPQYLAEVFGGVVACTQPRVMAAISIAKRIAVEYDNSTVGYNVGYQVGGKGNTVKGNQIMLMTDSALVKLSQDDSDLKEISVLMIDEAHERNLNTDIVLGIAKLLRAKRPDNFYVVIASATIDPKPFLDFFEKPQGTSLDVPGRTFPVTHEYCPPPPQISNKAVMEEHVIPTVITALKDYKEGHVLVFLPGQSEIEQAIKSFNNSIADFEDSQAIVALPLFGSLPPEEQDKIMQFDAIYGATSRMVVFCTNVAETSLTIPGVKLVIDQGMAKEVRYDQQRRLSVIELVRISKSSANQRMGRAGRISSGHCIRLYKDDDLTRDNIEPEILRASLDTVILQLIRLGYRPKDFPFMTRPTDMAIDDSVTMLEEVNCITAKASPGGVVMHEITDNGRLFAELPFDPRLSAFVHKCLVEYDSLELGAIIASVLSAPGNVYFTGGVDKEAKDEAKRRVAVRASRFDSDLLCMSQVVKDWIAAGDTDEKGNCKNCRRKCMRGKGCKICRVKYSVQEGLNNKVLDFCLSNKQSVVDTFTKARVKPSKSAVKSADEVDIVSSCLAQFFKEQIGSILVPKFPADGVQLMKAGVRARITNSSSFLQRFRAEPFEAFVSMSVTQLPNGEYIVDKMHPLKSDSPMAPPRSKKLELVYTNDCIGTQSFKAIRAWITKQITDPKWYWSVCCHSNSSLEIYNLSEHRAYCCDAIEKEIAAINKEHMDHSVTQVFNNGLLEMNVASGMSITSVGPMSNTWRIYFQNLDIQSPYEFRNWLYKKFGEAKLKPAIKFEKAFPPDENNNSFTGILTLTSKDLAEKILKDCAKYIKHNASSSDSTGSTQPNAPTFGSGSVGGGSAAAKEEDEEKEVEVRSHLSVDDFQQFQDIPQILLKTISKKNVDESEIKQRLKDYGVTKVTKFKSKKSQFTISLRNLPADLKISLHLLKVAIPKLEYDMLDLQPESMTISNREAVVGTNSHDAFINLEDSNTRVAIVQHLQVYFANSGIEMQHSFIDKAGRHKTKMVRPEVLVDQSKDVIGETDFALQFLNMEKLENFHSNRDVVLSGMRDVVHPSSNQGLHIFSNVRVKHSDLFTSLQGFVDAIASANQVQRKILKEDKDKGKENVCKVEFSSNASAKTVALAAAQLKSLTSSLVLLGNNDKLKSYYMELSKSKELSDAIAVIGCKITWEGVSVGAPRAEIFGPKYNQGQVMRKIVDMYDDFEKNRYSIFQLMPSVNALFSKGKAGEAAFRTFKDLHKDKCNLKHRFFSSDIVAHFKPKVTKGEVDSVLGELQSLIQNMGGSEVKKTSQCCFCKKESAMYSTFTICGHSCCNSCVFTELATGKAEVKDFLTCGKCKIPLHIKDLKSIFTPDVFSDYLVKKLTRTVKTNPNLSSICLCPNKMSNCSEILPKTKNPLQTCGGCKALVCVSCDIVCPANHAHIGKTCVEFIAAKREQEAYEKALKDAQSKVPKILEKLFADGEEFIAKNWTHDMPKRTRVDRNPGLSYNCKSLERFLKAVFPDGYPINDGFFAWHGTKEDAIVPISDAGFDPKYRRGQAYGPGEYFGTDANVSLGYSGGGSTGRMFLSYILNAKSAIRHVPGFCYVVNNDTTWVSSYCLPLLVVSYGIEAVPKFIVPKQVPVAPVFGGGKPSKETTEKLDKTKYTSPFRWKWQKDDRMFEPYTDEHNGIIESAFEGKANDVVIRDEIRRYIDDKLGSYRIDFKSLQQHNLATSYVRAVIRERQPIDPTSGEWYVFDDSNTWTRYEMLIEGKVDAHYLSYLNSTSGRSMEITFPGRPEKYRVDFSSGTQTNLASGTSRPVKRIAIVGGRGAQGN